MLSLRSIRRTVRHRGPVVGEERALLLDRFNAAVRFPGAHGGVTSLPLLLDALATGGPRSEGARWIVDDTARLDMAALVRSVFPEPEVHVVAAEYGAAGHEHGWLRLDRTLSPEESARLVETAEDWVASDRTLDDVVAAYGRPSVVFGSRGHRRPKTFGYASADRSVPLAVFHFGEAADASSARLLAFRSGHAFLDASLGFTPFGDAVAEERERSRG